ncbi:MAG: hypothetical protein M3Z06_00670 [Actinomycetota bacterium]|nr:hypothetical protein [Actinomycetota bacterium]
MRSAKLRRTSQATKIPIPGALGSGRTLTIPAGARTAARQFSQELSLAALIGGNLFGRLAMNPALAQITDKAERGKVLNRSWRRYGTVNSLALAGLVAGWLPTRRDELGALWVSRGERAMVLTKDVAVACVLITGLASAAAGVGFAREAPGGAVPIDSGHDPAPETPTRAARLKRLLNVLGALNLAAEVGLVAINVAMVQRRTRRLLKR